jgi:hypothetical protein
MTCNEGTVKSGPIYLRRLVGENEKRPIEPCTDFWRCPDIEIQGGIDAGTAKAPSTAGTTIDNYIQVTVRNAGTKTIENVEVQVWVCDYGVGIGPKGGIPSAGGPAGLGPRLLGDIASGASASAKLRWRVTHDDAIRNPDGHHCIIANAYGTAPDDNGLEISVTPPFTKDVIFICCDSHHGWRNINAKVASGMLIAQGEGEFVFPLLVGNPTVNDLEGILTVTQVQQGGFGPTEREHLLSGGHVEWTHPDQDPKCTRLVLGGDADLPPDQQVIVSGTDRPMLDLGLDGDLGSGSEVKFALRPDDVMPLRVLGRFDPKTQPGEVFIFDVVQRDSNGEVLSGARMLATVVR